MPTQLSGLSLGRKLVLGGGVLLFISSFLPWWHVSISFGGASASASASGWHTWGPLVFIVGILLLAWEGARLAGVAPVKDRQADTISALLGGLTALLAFIFFLVRLFGDATGWGIWIGLIALAAIAYGAFGLFTSSGGVASVKDLQSDLQSKAHEMREEHAASAPAESEPVHETVNETVSAPPVSEPAVTPAPVAEATDTATDVAEDVEGSAEDVEGEEPEPKPF